LVRVYRRLPKPADQRERVTALRLRLKEADRLEAKARRACERTTDQLRAWHEEIDAARSLFAPASPDDVIWRASEASASLAQLEAEHARMRSEHAGIVRPLRAELQERLTVLAEEGLVRPVASTTELRAQLQALEGCVERVGRQVEGLDAAAARAEISELERAIGQGRIRAEELKELIARAEEEVIADARLVAATLTAGLPA
jgi:hypothetical protein